MNKIYYNPQTEKMVIYNPEVSMVSQPDVSGLALYSHFLNVDITALGYVLVGEL